MTTSLTRRAVTAAHGADDVDHVVQELLRRHEGDLADPLAWVRFVRESVQPQTHNVDILSSPAAEGDETLLRLQTLVEVLRGGVDALSAADAVALADASDRLRVRRDPFVRPTYAADVGHHSAMASSGAAQMRFLATVLRYLNRRRVIEIGTAYGLGALAMARTGGDGIRIATAERSEPQLSIAREILATYDQVTVLGEIAANAPGVVADALEGPCDLLFHDGAHSREAYIEDFNAFAPHLAQGAIVIFDDIDWHDDRFHPDAQTYVGWSAIAQDPRVRASIEVDRNWGILLLV